MSNSDDASGCLSAIVLAIAGDTGRRSTTGKASCCATEESMQLSVAPVSTSAHSCLAARSGVPPGLYVGSNPISTYSVGPLSISAWWPSIPLLLEKPHLVCGIVPVLHHGDGKHHRRGTDLPNEVRTAAELLHRIGGSALEIIEHPDELAVMDDNPLAEVIGLELTAAGFELVELAF